MIIQSRHPVAVDALPLGWTDGFPTDEKLNFAFVFPKAGEEPELTASHDSTGADVAPLPKILEIVQRADEDYRRQGLTYARKPTRHSLEIRTGTYNQINYRNYLANLMLEGFLLEDPTPRSAKPKMRFTFFTGPSIPHLDTSKIDPGEIVYFGTNLQGTLSWEQPFLIPNRSGNNPFSETFALILLKEQAITTPKAIPSDMLVRARYGTFVHAKPRISRRKEGQRVLFRNVVRRNIRDKS